MAPSHRNAFRITGPLWRKDSHHNGRVRWILGFLPLSPPAWGWGGGGVLSWCGRAGGCQTGGTHISVTAQWILSIRISVELSRPLAVHWHGHLPICPIWTCPWAKNLSSSTQNWVQTLQIAYLLNCWMDILHLKFHGLVKTCSCALS